MNKLNNNFSALKGASFKGFNEKIHWENIFKRDDIAYECKIKSKSYNLLFRIMAGIFFNTYASYNLDISNNCKILFFLVYSTRKTNYIRINSIRALRGGDLISCNKLSYKLYFIEGAKLLFKLIPSWYSELKKYKINFNRKLLAILNLVHLWYFNKEISNIPIKKYKLLITYYDSLLYDSYLTELFKTYNIKTATLQHGQFISWRENVMENSGVELRSFKSDYFLCWNKFTIDEAIKSGIDKNKLILTGIIGYINGEQKQCILPNNNTFGVVLGHPMYEEENIKLIEAANILSKETGLNYYIKLHPNYNVNHFNNFYDQLHFKGLVKKGIEIYDYANSVDFSIVGSSSVYVELIFINHSVIKYSSKDIKDKYSSINKGAIFHDVSNIVDVYKSNDMINKKEELFDYLCSERNVKEKYLEFIDYCLQ